MSTTFAIKSAPGIAAGQLEMLSGGLRIKQRARILYLYTDRCIMARSSPPSTLPPFEPVTLTELRTFWMRYPNDDIRRLILEVQRYRTKLKEIDRLYQTTQTAWHDNVGGELVALNWLRSVMFEEKFRIG